MSGLSREENTEYNRRDFLRIGAAGGLGTALGGLSLSGCAGFPKPGMAARPKHKPLEVVRIGFVGLGVRGTRNIGELLKLEGVELRAVCDLLEDEVVKIQKIAREAGRPEPVGYSRGPTDFIRMCEQEDLDLVYNATPWELHTPICVAAMESGKHAATEVPAAVTLDECWQLVETAEKTGRHCVMLENCCYGRIELMVLNMVRRGIFGELLHGEAGYQHDLRASKFATSSEGLWRRAHSIKRNGNLYPTHGLGPVAQCMNINRGDRFDYLVSMSCNSRGLKLYAEEHFPCDDPRRKEKFANGDVNTSLIRTVHGLTIMLKHDCDTPRPYSRINHVQGVRGLFRGYPDQIYIEGRSPQHRWESIDKYLTEYDHPLWKLLHEKAAGSGHGGMDYVLYYRLIAALRRGTEPDMDVYDAAAWSAVSELSEWSVANKSRPVDFPDFTRGQWKTKPPLGIVGS